MVPQQDTHAYLRLRSYRNLEDARQAAFEKCRYNSTRTRAIITSLFRERHKSDPHLWQLDVTEAIILGLDSIVIAGTGAGKTMPFMMPLLDNKKVIVISPLKVLQLEQAERFEKMKLAAVAVNGDTWNSELQKDLEQGKYRGIFTSPEMCLKHTEFRNHLTSSFQDICAVIVDEAHCIAQWGGDFRTAYSEIGKLRAFFPPNIPILATSATLPQAALQEVRSQLGIDAADSFFLNLGNDRPNIEFSVHKMNSSTDFKALKPLLTRKPNPSTPDDFHKSIVFIDSVQSSHQVLREVRSWYPRHLRKHIDFLHAHRSPKAKRRAMRRFRNGRTRILITTEAAGMGADISDIEQVIQFGVPSSLSVWMQRAGRAGRDPSINACAILLVEKSMFEQQKIRKGRKKKGVGDEAAHEVEEEIGGGDEVEVEVEVEEIRNEEDAEGAGDDVAGAVGGDAEGPPTVDEHAETPRPGYEFRKKVDKDLRCWIVTKDCRRDVADDYFGNPPREKAPTGACCDNCDGLPADLESSRPSTPVQSTPPGSSHSTPSKSVNENGKRPMTEGKKPSTRRGDLLQAARDALINWRFNTKRARYNPSSVTAESLMPENVLKTLASSRRISCVEDIETETHWLFAQRHGEVLAVLRHVDQAHYESKQAAKQAKKSQSRTKSMQQPSPSQTQRPNTDQENQPLTPRAQGLRSSKCARQPWSNSCSVFSSGTPVSVPTPGTMSTNVLCTPSGGLLDFSVSTPMPLAPRQPS
ncbi:unnamed protein product [Cyclocybe aegerita]|uniref:DNA 3'-5' helicase n=1 Tax=Cyclocybe aegerita TaxID=1973307 RepID=A0A8S0WUF3_CYCAE|nr:unnamed protein product [Cyclocybe aegerita]